MQHDERGFIRKYELVIGRNSEVMERILPVPVYTDYVTKRQTIDQSKIISNDYSFLDKNKTYYKDLFKTPAQTLTITDLQIEATVANTNNFDIDNVKGPSVITIYNLNPQNRNYMRTGNTVLLKAGYRADKHLPLIYVGTIIHAEHKQEGANWLTYLHCGADAVTNQNKISKSYPPGITLQDILGDLLEIAGSLGISTALDLRDPFVLDALPTSYKRPYPFGYAVQGNIIDMISTVCSQNGLRCYMVLGKLYIEPKYAPPEYRAIIKIGPENVKGSLSEGFDAAGLEQTSQGSPEMLTGTLFLNGNIAPGILARINQGAYRGDYTIRSVVHKLNYEGSEWDTEIHCEQVKANAPRS